MATNPVLPNMGLTLPIPGTTQALGVAPAGQSWLELINSAFGLIDGHTHAPGFGALIVSSGLNINADVSWGSNNITSLRSARFAPIALGSLTGSDVGAVIVSGVDLYFVDVNGTQIRLTSAGGVAGTPGSIGGLVSPAAATYTPASKLFSFTSSSGFVAGVSCGPLVLGDATVSAGKAATLQVPAGLAANYVLTLPTALPGATSFLTISSTGALGDSTALLGALTTANLASAAGILGTQLANATIGSAQIAANGVARSNLVVVGQQVSNSSGLFSTTGSGAFVDVTNLSVTITTTGRPVMLMVVADGTANLLDFSNTGSAVGEFQMLRGAGIIGFYNAPAGLVWPSLSLFDVPAAGTYTYKFQAFAPGAAVLNVKRAVLVAYEL